MHIHVLPLARPTFDVPYAEEALAAMRARLDAWAEAGGHRVTGSDALLMGAEDGALDASADVLLILQVTFTDAGFATAAACGFDGRVAVWAAREPRAGGRLRLNAMCGLNLLSHALGLAGRDFAWAYGEAADLDALTTGPLADRPPLAEADAAPRPVRALRIGRIGAHPDGFDTCRYDAGALKALAGAEVEEIPLPDLFDRARAVPEEAVAPYAAKAAGLVGAGELDAGEMDRSTRLAAALDGLRAERRFDAMAIRCWPETFTEYGGAVCGPVSMLGEARVPCACEADVYGALTQSILQDVADAPVFLADLVDADDDTVVAWHCGQAPASMAAGTPEATVHTNRRQALLYQFALRPGRVTLFRVSQANGAPHVALATGEVVDAPMAFTGTSGTIRPDGGGAAFLRTLIDARLEHHMALAYGDHAAALRGVAAGLGVPVLEMTA
ncbi:hypothetical protein JQC91_01505 [Jannaschia sp. Os4]|uniref:hypothetical protein n=1 Tax=Jannaschia sp. Os4 TaxID=2807617 RepID=UPI00193A6962|nr:hypothetical protein [Jannaschia sp. Os4]MBM2574968.1 hypothetical protein [Jannaschia sp. Os4]